MAGMANEMKQRRRGGGGGAATVGGGVLASDGGSLIGSAGGSSADASSGGAAYSGADGGAIAATAAPLAPPPQKSLFVAYMLWLLGGLWGAHHLYLGRDSQAIIWSASFGGFFGLGWLRDAWRLPAYVRAANCTPDLVHRVVLEYSLSPRRPPRSGVGALLGQVVLALWLGELFATSFDLLQPEALPRFPTWSSSGASLGGLLAALSALPHLLRMVSVALRVVGVALGATIVGNFSPNQSSDFLPVLAATTLAQGLAMAFISPGSTISASAGTKEPPLEVTDEWTDRCWTAILVAVAVYTWRRRWSLQARQMISREQTGAGNAGGVLVGGGAGSAEDAALAKSIRNMMRDSPAVVFSPKESAAPDARPLAQAGRRGFCVRFLRYMLAAWLFLALDASYVLNCSVDHTPLKVSLARSLASPDMQRLWSALQIQWSDFRRKGHSEWWRSLKAEMDLGGLDDSYATLGFTPQEVNEGVSATQLRKRRNQLALKYHPDKSAEGLTPLERDTKFAEIQKAYEKIVKARADEEAKPAATATPSSSTSSSTSSGSSSDGGYSSADRSSTKPPPQPKQQPKQQQPKQPQQPSRKAAGKR